MNNGNISPSNLVNNTVITVLMYCLDRDDIRSLEALGVSKESAEKLRGISSKGRSLITSSPVPIITTVIDDKALDIYLERFKSKEKEEAFINQLILAEAPANLLKVNFGIERKEFTMLRDRLGIKSPNRGRPKNSDFDNCPKALQQILEDFIQNDSKIDLIEDPKLLLDLSDTYKIAIREVLGYYTYINKELM